jgi:hypothetical protein
MQMAERIQIRRDTAANWTSVNPTLAQGELGVETDTLKFKVGDGTSAWTSLNYLIDAGDYLTATSTNTLTNKTISGASNTLTVDGTNAVGFKNIPRSGSAKTTSYILATGDVGKFIEVGASGSITIPNNVFVAGDVVSIFNNTTGDVTITCTITTAYIAGVNTDEPDVALATRGICTILFISGTVCVISGNVS